MSTPLQRPRALVVFESMFGNTQRLAEAVAERLSLAGYDVTITAVTAEDAPTGPLDADLVVVGAPTHAFSLSRPTTRAEAVRQGAAPERAATGLREWLDRVAPAPGYVVPLVAFDTRMKKSLLPKAAGPRAVRLARKRGFAVPLAPAAFLVAEAAGPLLDGELVCARAWADTVAATTLAAA